MPAPTACFWRAGAVAAQRCKARSPMPLASLHSGGQTGVDRAALDVAIELGIPYGGWIPKGRLAEDGPISHRYESLRETESPDYDVRTERNVRDTDATLLLTFGPATGGTSFTKAVAIRLARPMLEIDLAKADFPAATTAVRAWLAELGESVRLNVAGPRASQAPLAYAHTREFLLAVLRG
jgi:Circularly permutated YpsA SLOG family